ncbi:MAG: tRNA (adenosine(37)-N6)-threonylcarbamoyltransferase complex ATPase subunit type 1 TsaE [Flavobacteriaceae bacterium]|nr:tRNA (adenosine(37)-N6)-threonylcarbamoyltransferase complex ATPase subunit type 1 TsaE [Flavobacteriaceae bacterium]
MKKTYSLSEIDEVANELLPQINSNIVLLNGEMGAGKTTMIKALCKALKCPDVVSSPTFSLINEYRTVDHKPLYHFDCYRIENEEEAYDFGAEEYLYSGHLCLIEWSENIQSLLPENCSLVTLEKVDSTTRKITLT